MPDPKKLEHFGDCQPPAPMSPYADFAQAILHQVAESMGVPAEIFTDSRSPLQMKADAIGDQCCADLETIALSWRECGL